MAWDTLHKGAGAGQTGCGCHRVGCRVEGGGQEGRRQPAQHREGGGNPRAACTACKGGSTQGAGGGMGGMGDDGRAVCAMRSRR